jgi:transcriptional regulator with XRE-family HTH domain
MLRGMRTVVRRSLAIEDRDLAQQIGARLRAARSRAGLTQQQVAGDRYTKAYVSALENGLIKPSMAALRYLAGRLGTTPSDLLTDADERWAGLEAELRLAAGDWQAAADMFSAALERSPEGRTRARLMVGLAEALFRLGRSSDVIRIASEADDRFTQAGMVDEARRARYWLAAAHHLADNPAEARALFEQLLADHSVEHPLDPDLHIRLLVALATVQTAAGEPQRALLLLEEARGIRADLDDRRRATLLASLAYGYRATGDMEGAVRSALQALGLFRSAEAVREAAMLENELALIFLGMGNLVAARQHASEARETCQNLKQDFLLAHVLDTEAQIALADGQAATAVDRAEAAVDLARRTGNQKAEISALLTEARAARSSGDRERAGEILGAAVELARGGPKARLRELLSAWSELLAEAGDHQRAYELSREALALV